MKKDIGDHIISKLDLQDIAKVLSDELSGSELNTVLLDIFNKRVQQETPSSLLSKYEGNKLVKPALLEDVLEYKEKELRCYKLIAGRGFEPIELSPVAQFGTNSVIATVDQKKVLTSLRNTEVDVYKRQVLFSEDHIQETRRRGRIEVICGSMFSGKTEELIRRMKRAKFARQRVEIFKPAIDTRYSEEDVVSHDSHSIASTPIDSSASILLFTSEIDVVGIDEAQFFDDGLIDVCRQLANNGIRVIIAGLDMDFKGNPFGPMPQLCAIADEVSKVHAICVKCGDLASFSHRTVKNDKQVLLGETAEYEPLCRECYLRARGEDGQKI